jgi:hypothetical protein
MSRQSPSFPDIKAFNAKLFSDIDPKDINDFSYLDRVQQNCMEQVNPFSCYVTIMLGKEPKITWRHNTANHFGLMNIQFEELIGLIHPSWQYAFINYGKVMYEVAFKYGELFMQNGATASRLLPMRHRSGKYYWYHQISVKVADNGENVAAHLNYYQQSTPYDSQLPAMPQMATSGEVNKIGMRELNRLALEFLPDFLGQILSEAQVKFMLQYREIIHENGGEKQVKGGLLPLLEDVDTLENLNKLKQRIRGKVKDYFQHPSLDSAHSFALWLNRYFPL